MIGPSPVRFGLNGMGDQTPYDGKRHMSVQILLVHRVHMKMILQGPPVISNQCYCRMVGDIWLTGDLCAKTTSAVALTVCTGHSVAACGNLKVAGSIPSSS